MSIRVERSGRVLTVVIDRPEARNAVDGPAARALDLILTGRSVGASEAHAIGLANRLVAKGESRAAAEALAAEIARFPQACLRSHRKSAYEQWDLPLEQALAGEFHGGMATIQSGETLAGAARFAQGAGRHGNSGS